ncbi:fibronectin type III domain-containing protein [Pelotomaculum isophthalicicum JI]|uniref:Fibronectin type III domain-containing protein n=1 Tax=Pelotomaculum isophthalicicum JI TaxID=947010 RepID=A0A9X4GYC2_9FIRM|nr:fibronectin type III domain-containing protein [Pelotomaculum isophthalicicum]MDF9407670.1 fibronectin type III domain-containing protein [Pelotomaculum isophthalicicum JI]
MSWSGATDNVSVTGYRLYKNGVKIADIPAGTYSYTVSGLTKNASYTFSIEAGDAAGNWSNSGPTARVKTKKTP